MKTYGKGISRLLITAVWMPFLSAANIGTDTIFASLGGQKGISTNSGALVTVNPANAAVTVIGVPAGGAGISGLAFDSTGNLWGSTQIGGGIQPPPDLTTSNLIQINPVTGAQISSVPITTTTPMGVTPVSIADLAIQPGTNTIFGIQSPNDANFTGQANLYTISTGGVATFVGTAGVFFGSIAFAPNGTLYMTSADLVGTVPMIYPCPPSDPDQINCALKTLSPVTAATLTSVPTSDFYSALGISNEGVIWAGTGAGDLGAGIGQFFAGISTLNPATGVATFIGNTGTDFVGDIAFLPFVVGPGQCVPFPLTLAAPAGPAGAFITLTSSDPSKVGLPPGNAGSLTVFFPPGTTTPESRMLEVCGVNFGSATITATEGSSTIVSETVQVTATLSFAAASVTIPAARAEARLTLNLSAPAPAGGLKVNLSSDNPGVATVPATITIPANSTSVIVPVTGVAAGSTLIHASALPNVPDTSVSVTVI